MSSVIDDNKKNEEADLNKENPIFDQIIYLLTIMVLVGTGYMISQFDRYWEERSYLKQDFTIPHLTDLRITLYSIPIFSLIKFIFSKAFNQIMFDYILGVKYKNQFDEKNWELGQIYKKKLTTQLFKICYFIFNVSLGYYICKDMDIFPFELGGKSDMMKIFDGKHNNIFFNRHPLFNYYYLISLGYNFTDLIWLLFFYEAQSDFPIMLLHHSATISMIAFSYLTSLSNYGVVVLFLHDFTDIFVYISRIIINTNLKSNYKLMVGFVFIVVYFYMRIYTLGKSIIMSYLYFDDFNVQLTLMMRFLCLLQLMHIYWLYQIILRFCFKNFTDVGKIKLNKK